MQKRKRDKTRGLTMFGDQGVARLMANCRHSACGCGLLPDGRWGPVYLCRVRMAVMEKQSARLCVHMYSRDGLCKNYTDYQDPPYRKHAKEEVF